MATTILIPPHFHYIIAFMSCFFYCHLFFHIKSSASQKFLHILLYFCPWAFLGNLLSNVVERVLIPNFVGALLVVGLCCIEEKKVITRYGKLSQVIKIAILGRFCPSSSSLYTVSKLAWVQIDNLYRIKGTKVTKL